MEGYSIVSFFQKGGLFMYPIMLVFLAGMAITVERWFHLNGIRHVNRKIWNVLQPVLAKGEFEKAKSIISKDGTAFEHCYPAGTARHHHGIDRGLYRSCQCEPCREGRSALRQYFGGHEHHGLRADVGDPASAFPCQIDVNHRPDCGQPGDGIGKSTEQSFRFQQASLRDEIGVYG